MKVLLSNPDGEGLPGCSTPLVDVLVRVTLVSHLGVSAHPLCICTDLVWVMCARMGNGDTDRAHMSPEHVKQKGLGNS